MGKIIEWLFYVLLFSFVLPSGSIIGIPVKILLVLAIFGCIFVEMLRQNKIVVDRYTIRLIEIVVIMILWGILSVAGGFTPGLKTFLKSFFSLISVIIITLICIQNKWVDIEKAIKVLWMAVIFYVGLKILIEMALIVHVISYDAVGVIFEKLLNAEWMSLEFRMGPITCYRITTSNDTIPLILMSIELACGKKTIIRKFSLIGVMAVYSMIVYSRVVIVQFLAMALIGIFYYFKKEGLTYKNMLIILSGIVCLLLAVAFLFLYKDGKIIDNVSGALEYRFSGTQVEASDGVRNDQFAHLYEGFLESPFVGHGLGSYVKDFIRSESNPHSYELEYLSYMYQFGVIGFFLVICGMIYTFFEISVKWCKDRIAQIILLLNFVIWLIKPFFNPGFMSSSSGMTIVSFALLALYYTKLKENSMLKEI